ncbi:MAG: hypothetical protein ACK4XJ_04460 [Fimbriimonadaceae bacterium]
MTLVTERELRLSAAEIERSNGSPVRRARLLVRLARRARNDAKRLAQGVAILASDCMDDAAERLWQAKRRRMDLSDEIRARARDILAGGPSASHP